MGVIGLLVVMFPLEWIANPSVTVSLDQNAFSPNDDGILEDVSAFYTLSEPADVMAVVLNSAGVTMRTLVNQQPENNGQHAVKWNGRDDSGQIVPDGLYQIAVTAAATARQNEHSVPVEVDTTPPTLQLANLANEQLTTAESVLTIEGTTDANVSVLVSGDPRPIPVDARGLFRVTRQLSEGVNILDVRAVDAAGNESIISREVMLRTQPPELVLLEPAENNAFVKNSLITVRGVSTSDATVTINGNQATVNEEGQFLIDLVLDEGENIIRVVASDPVGNQSAVERYINLNSTAPTITLASVPDGLVVHDPSLRVSGKTNAAVQLQVNGNPVPVDANGNFSALVPLQGGNNLLTVTASDLAGNASSVQRTVHYKTGGAVANTPQWTIPDLPNSPFFWRVLIGIGLVGGSLWLFGGLSSPIAFDLTVDYPVFYPNRPTERRMLIMRMNLSRGAKIALDVYDEFNRHIATLVDERKMSNGEHFRLWDGRNNIGQTLHGGSYLVQATARTATNTATSAVWVRLDPSQNTLVGVGVTQSTETWVDEEQIIDVG
jgi:flagellar hook assembly protein FlgD